MNVQTAYQRLVRIERLRAECIRNLKGFAPYDVESGSRLNAITSDDVLQIVSDVTGVKRSDIVSKKRARTIVIARMLVSYICRNDLRMSFEKVGKVVNRTHCSILHQVRVVDNELEFTAKTNNDAWQIKESLDQCRQLIEVRQAQLV